MSTNNKTPRSQCNNEQKSNTRKKERKETMLKQMVFEKYKVHTAVYIEKVFVGLLFSIEWYLILMVKFCLFYFVYYVREQCFVFSDEFV